MQAGRQFGRDREIAAELQIACELCSGTATPPRALAAGNGRLARNIRYCQCALAQVSTQVCGYTDKGLEQPGRIEEVPPPLEHPVDATSSDIMMASS